MFGKFCAVLSAISPKTVSAPVPVFSARVTFSSINKSHVLQRGFCRDDQEFSTHELVFRVQEKLNGKLPETLEHGKLAHPRFCQFMASTEALSFPITEKCLACHRSQSHNVSSDATDSRYDLTLL